jgi:aminopeptidase N
VRGRRAAASGALVAGVLALGACTGSTPVISSVHRPQPSPSVTAIAGPPKVPGIGADGIGDAYYPKAGNGGYDVGDYNLDLKYEPATDKLTGTAKITATATERLTRFNFDLKALTVDTITIDGETATAKANGDELEVTPARLIDRGATFVTTIHYSGVPQPYQDDKFGQDGFLNTDDGAVAIGEPEVAAAWYPVNDHPRDKATYTVKITAPDGLTAMSNGALSGKSSAGGWTTWTWVEDAPMASYLATVAIGKYRVAQSTHNGIPVFLAVDTSLDPEIDAALARTPEIIDYLATMFGPYPFDAMGGIVIDDKRIRFALENQTRPIYSWSFFHKGSPDTLVIVHELTHQWYGDSVSVDQWKEIWLNEGFATYAEWLWQEHNGGSSPQQTFDTYYNRADSPIWKVPAGNPGKAELFGESVYTRGGMTVQALRTTVGDDAFFKILKAWAATKKYSNATTPEFIATAEKISGKQLDQLFSSWLYGTVRPPRP